MSVMEGIRFWGKLFFITLNCCSIILEWQYYFLEFSETDIYHCSCGSQ